MVDRNYPLPLKRQAQALGIGRGSVYYKRLKALRVNPNRDNCIRHLHRKHPAFSRRDLCEILNRGGVKVSRYRVDKVIKAMTFKCPQSDVGRGRHYNKRRSQKARRHRSSLY